MTGHSAIQPLKRLAVILGLGLLSATFASLGLSAAATGMDHDRTQKADLVVVKKSERKLYLYRQGMLMAEYPVALGLHPTGTKRIQGDNKTPIGAYTLDWRNPDSDFHRSLHISYPNAEDRTHALSLGLPPGGEIMIHGQPSYDSRPRHGDWTDGCIAVSDPHIEDIWRHVDAGTKIHIYP